MNYHIWHNTRGKADQYFVVRNMDNIVLFSIPKWLGRKMKGENNGKTEIQSE